MYYSTVSFLSVCPRHVHRSRDDAGARPVVSRWPLAFSPSLAWHSSVSVPTLVLIKQRTHIHTRVAPVTELDDAVAVRLCASRLAALHSHTHTHTHTAFQLLSYRAPKGKPSAAASARCCPPAMPTIRKVSSPMHGRPCAEATAPRSPFEKAFVHRFVLRHCAATCPPGPVV